MRNPPRPDPIRSKRRSKDAALSWLRSTSIDRFAPHPHDPISMLHDDVAHEALPYAACTRIVGGVAPEKASWLARSDPLRSVLRARRGKYNKSACIRPGRWHREACAVFSLAAPFQSAHGEKGEVTLPPNAKITSQQCPLKCHYSPSPPLGHLFIGWFLLGQNGETGSISTKTSRLETAAYRSRLALLRKTLAAFRPRLANDLAV